MPDRSNDTRSRFQQLIFAASLPGLLTIPLAFLHNQEFTRSWNLESDFNSIFYLICTLDVVVGTLLTLLGIRLASTHYLTYRSLATWTITLVLGTVTGFFAVFALHFHAEAVNSPSLQQILFFGSVLSTGLFYLFGVLQLLLGKHFNFSRIGIVGHIIWIIVATIGGSFLTYLLFDKVIQYSGVGIEGEGVLALVAWPYFCWGAAFGAMIASSKSNQRSEMR
jgi:hypothetical protein